MPTDERANIRLLPPSTRRPSTTGDDRAMHLTLVPTATGGRAGFPRTTTDTRRAPGSAVPKEPTAMYSVHQGHSLPYLYAESRRRDMLAEAEQARRLAQAASVAPRRFAVAALRRQVGAALVRAGQRVQGVGAGQPADALPTIGTLRGAR
jgi:hypothetical protein